ncbi:RNA polymerase sigma factor [Pedobacter sp.]|uniref:RNA polymerase sigma factor n=1 Tax=Pedobacter sp. TaxID=1411316 RepID=UPI003BAD09F7
MKGYEKFTDQDLWKLIKQDDVNAFNQLYQKFWSKMFSTAFSYIKDRELCIEVTNDIFLNIWTKRHELQIESFSAYLTASTRYHIYRKLKTLRKTPIDLIEDYETVVHQTSTLNDGESKLNCTELKLKAEAHLMSLPNRCREIFMMSRNEFIPNQEIANHFNISKRTVENQITIALRHLRMCLKMAV